MSEARREWVSTPFTTRLGPACLATTQIDSPATIVARLVAMSGGTSKGWKDSQHKRPKGRPPVLGQSGICLVHGAN